MCGNGAKINGVNAMTTPLPKLRIGIFLNQHNPSIESHEEDLGTAHLENVGLPADFIFGPMLAIMI